MMFKYAILSSSLLMHASVWAVSQLHITTWDIVGPGPRNYITFSTELPPASGTTLPYTITLP